MTKKRNQELRVRVVPNESVWAVHTDAEMAELVEELQELGHQHGVKVKMSSRAREPRPVIRPTPAAGGGRSRGRLQLPPVPPGGASPIEAWELVVAFGAGFGAKLALHQVERLADELVDALVAWVRRRCGRRRITGHQGRRITIEPDATHIRIYGPNGETLRDVLVEGREGKPPEARPRRHPWEGY